MRRGEPPRYDLRNLRASEHADLDRCDVEVLQDSVDLRADDSGWRVVDRPHAARVLSGQRRDHARAIDAERRESLEIGLNPRAATGV
jgi:hypothetical protein